MNENGDDTGSSRRYVVREEERVEADREAAFMRLLAFSPDYAARWLKGLLKAIAQLPEFPGPLSRPIDEQASARYGRQVRRMLYAGPGKRRAGRAAYRVLFTILPTASGEEATILVLRLLHGAAQQSESQENTEL